jgi:hypothetical protein
MLTAVGLMVWAVLHELGQARLRLFVALRC